MTSRLATVPTNPFPTGSGGGVISDIQGVIFVFPAGAVVLSKGFGPVSAPADVLSNGAIAVPGAALDAIVPPGVTINEADAGWQPPALTDPQQRRRPVSDRSAS